MSEMLIYNSSGAGLGTRRGIGSEEEKGVRSTVSGKARGWASNCKQDLYPTSHCVRQQSRSRSEDTYLTDHENRYTVLGNGELLLCSRDHSGPAFNVFIAGDEPKRTRRSRGRCGVRRRRSFSVPSLQQVTMFQLPTQGAYINKSAPQLR